MEDNAPATKRDLERVVETMRDIETHMLTEFHRYGRGQQARLHDVESSEHAMKVRIAALEERVLELKTVFARSSSCGSDAGSGMGYRSSRRR
jgi:hypothetical protein